MKIVAISDTHSRHREVRLPKGDILLHAGDISYKGRKEELVDFLDWFSKQKFPHKIFIGGNHDFYLEHAGQKEIEKLIPEGVTYLNDSGITINGTKFWGSPVTPWFHNWAFNRHRGKEINKHWELIAPDTDVLITHGPVYGFLDQVVNEQHVGCQDLLR
ncbi:MAG: metallophosphatase domain-containing protein, partial [Flavisolibacter sp.]